MRCSICGAELKKEGDICSNCYKEVQEEEEFKKDIKEVLKVRRKYSVAYEFVKYMEIIGIFTLCMVVFVITRSWGEFFILLGILAVILGVLLFIDKRIANATKATFYEKKAVYNFHLLFIKRTKMVKYKDIKDIGYYQTFRQKRMGYGDICIYAKGSIPGATLLNGFQIKNVENVVDTVKKIQEIVGI